MGSGDVSERLGWRDAVTVTGARRSAERCISSTIGALAGTLAAMLTVAYPRRRAITL